MKVQTRLTNRLAQFGFLAALILCPFSLRANPIPLPEKPIAPEITFLITASILLEAACILLLLRRFRKPRFFILWILGLHVITYPAFMGFLWLFQDARPSYAVAQGEGLMVVIEGTLIYIVCRCVPAKQNFPTPSLLRSWLASLVGNACSLAAFPLLMTVYRVAFHGV